MSDLEKENEMLTEQLDNVRATLRSGRESLAFAAPESQLFHAVNTLNNIVDIVGLEELE